MEEIHTMDEYKQMMKCVLDELMFLFPRCVNKTCGNTIYTKILSKILYRKSIIRQGDTYPIAFSCKSTEFCDIWAHIHYISRFSN